MDFKPLPLLVNNSYNHVNLFQFEVKLGSRSKITRHFKPLNILRQHACFCFPLMLFAPPRSVISFPRISRGPSHHKSGSLNNKYSTTQHPQAQQKSPANVRTPSITPPEPLPNDPKTIENPSRATAVVVGRVHLGPRRDQLLDHGGMALRSRLMQRRHASGVEDTTPTAGRLQLPSRNKACQKGCFSRWGQNSEYRS